MCSNNNIVPIDKWLLFKINTVYCKSFEVEKFHSCITKLHLLENFHGWTIVLHGKSLFAQDISLEKFCGTDQSTKTAKLFLICNIYGIIINVLCSNIFPIIKL